jgi:hypothetical protein
MVIADIKYFMLLLDYNLLFLNQNSIIPQSFLALWRLGDSDIMHCGPFKD